MRKEADLRHSRFGLKAFKKQTLGIQDVNLDLIQDLDLRHLRCRF